MKRKDVIERISKNLIKYLTENRNIKSLVIGVSGGIDSAICCALAYNVTKDMPDVKLIGRSIPIYSNKEDEIMRADLVGKAFCDDFKVLDFEEQYHSLKFDLGYFNSGGNKGVRIRDGNIKARLRMIALYHTAHANNGLVLSTDNWTEYLLGFWTLHGDVGDLGMIQELWKTEVYDISDYIINKSSNFNSEQKEAISKCHFAVPTDGLGVSRTDLDQIMPNWSKYFSNCREGYKFVDLVLQNKHREMSFKLQISEDEFLPIQLRYAQTLYKRNNPYNFKREKLIK